MRCILNVTLGFAIAPYVWIATKNQSPKNQSLWIEIHGCIRLFIQCAGNPPMKYTHFLAT
jgi:hypothetical protein